MRRPSYTGVV
ncbi:hypothetical protein E2C01_073321 [Portunus trituberculatus]|uniref:Uncharacterized protein n=1 Tax=Portunus trituberculatus TaxID=210409 RepID=A0A5B7I954_PORTR|nr:hypothetical protein [Portunus trituberculatus]